MYRISGCTNVTHFRKTVFNFKEGKQFPISKKENSFQFQREIYLLTPCTHATRGTQRSPFWCSVRLRINAASPKMCTSLYSAVTLPTSMAVPRLFWWWRRVNWVNTLSAKFWRYNCLVPNDKTLVKRAQSNLQRHTQVPGKVTHFGLKYPILGVVSRSG